MSKFLGATVLNLDEEMIELKAVNSEQADSSVIRLLAEWIGPNFEVKGEESRQPRNLREVWEYIQQIRMDVVRARMEVARLSQAVPFCGWEALRELANRVEPDVRIVVENCDIHAHAMGCVFKVENDADIEALNRVTGIYLRGQQ